MKTKTTKKRSTTHDPVRRRLEQINRSLRHGLRLKENGLWITFNGEDIHLAVPTDLQLWIRLSLSGKGEKPATVARRLNIYGLSEWQRRFMNCFPESEPDADRLKTMSDESWTVI